jgi:hypothetical protein
MALRKNREKVLRMMEILAPRIIGQEVSTDRCGCGVGVGFATAKSIWPGGNEYPGQEKSWNTWVVRAQAADCETYHTVGPDQFIPASELDEMFAQCFNGSDISEGKSYHLVPGGVARVKAKLPAAVRISKDDSQTVFYFDWGKEQMVAADIVKIHDTSGKRLYKSSDAYKNLFFLLRKLRPKVYRGGPVPELPFENDWLLDYKGTLKLCDSYDGYHNIFLEGFQMSYKGKADSILTDFFKNSHCTQCIVRFSQSNQ